MSKAAPHQNTTARQFCDRFWDMLKRSHQKREPIIVSHLGKSQWVVVPVRDEYQARALLGMLKLAMPTLFPTDQPEARDVTGASS